MRRPIFTGLLVLLAVVLLAAGLLAKRELSIDSCLDRGGRWNDQAAACERATD